MTAQQLFARQAFAMALGSLGIEVELEAVEALDWSSNEVRCTVRDPKYPLWRIAKGFFQGDEDGGCIIINLVHQRPVAEPRSRWFMAHLDGTPIPLEDVTIRREFTHLVVEEELAEAL